MTTVLINPFDVPPGVRDDRFLAGWEQAAEYMSARPGFVSSQLHRALNGEARFRFINIAEWRSPADFQAAVNSQEFRDMASSGVPPNYPALYEVVRRVGARPSEGGES